jgi:hypothetical protein
MKRRILIAVFALGTLAGYGSSAVHAIREHRERRAAFEHHVAKVCVDAARESTTPDH